MVLVMPSDVKDTMSTNDRENWTRILAAQNPFKLYDHMKAHLTKAVSDQVQDKEAELARTKQEPGESLAGFLVRLQEIFDQLSAYGAERTDQQKGYVLVNNTRVEIFKDLYKKYGTSKKPLPSYNELQDEYKKEEKAEQAVASKLENQQTESAVKYGVNTGASAILASVTPAKVHFQSGGGFQLPPPTTGPSGRERTCWQCHQPGHSRHECPVWLEKKRQEKLNEKKPAAAPKPTESSGNEKLPKCVVCGSHDHRYDYVCPKYEETQKKLGLPVLKPQMKKNKFFRRVYAAPAPAEYDACMNTEAIEEAFGSSSQPLGSTAHRR
jgi:hypothetical protein